MPNATNITPPRVPVVDPATGLVTRDWYRFFANLFTLTGAGQNSTTLDDIQVGPATDGGGDIGVIAQDIQALAVAPPTTPHSSNDRYGVFISTATQTAAAINTAYAMTLNTTQMSSGVVLSGTYPSRVYVDRAGVYNFQFSAQLNKASASTKQVFIWARINGIDVPYSATAVALSGSSAATVAAWNFVLELNASDYFELIWSTNDTGCQIQAVAAASPVPAIPSIILTVTDNIKG